MLSTNKYILAKHQKKRLNEYFNEIRNNTAEKETFQEEQPEQKEIDREERSFFKSELTRIRKQRNALQLSLASYD
jgi:hypothetical protein